MSLYTRGRRGKHRLASLSSSIAAALLSAAPVLAQSSIPELPRVYVDTALVASTGQTITVSAGGDFQAALYNAQRGDVIVLQAGATFTGPFTLPAKSGSGWITVRSSASDASLPAPGSRISPSYAPVLPKLQAPAPHPYVINTAPGAAFYRFVGIEIRPTTANSVNALVELGNNDTSVDTLPHHIIFDRCYLHGDPQQGSRRAVILNAQSVAVIDSHLSDFKSTSFDAQALVGWNGPGPFKIVNNYLEGAAENVNFGGSVPTIPGLIPADIEIRRNHFSKPLAWKTQPWLVKNLIEFKSGRRVLIDGNLFENVWPAGQGGYAFMLTPRGDSGTWAALSDFTITNNIVRHTAGGLYLSGHDTTSPGTTERGARFLVKNNLFDDVGGSMAGEGILFLLYNGIQDLTIDHNTALQSGHIDLTDSSSELNPGLVYRNNIHPHNAYGFFAGGVGDYALNTYFPGSVFQKNAMIGPWPTAAGVTSSFYTQHPDNFFPSSLAAVGFVDAANKDYRLAASSPFRNAGTDGKDLGVDFDLLDVAMGDTPAPPPTPTPTPIPTPTPTPDSTSPSVSITSPSNGATIAATVAINASYSDNVGVTMTKYFVDGLSVAAYAPPQPSYSWSSKTVADGAHTLAVTAYDAAGNSRQTSISVTTRNADTTPPTVSIVAPANNTSVNKSVVVKTQATDGVGLASIRVYGDGALLGTIACAAKTTCAGNVTWDTKRLAAGNHGITVNAVDTSGNTSATASVTVRR